MSVNDGFLSTLTRAFETYLKTSARSNEKLKILHAKIANDLAQKLGANLAYTLMAWEMARRKSSKGDIMKKLWILWCVKTAWSALEWR